MGVENHSYLSIVIATATVLIITSISLISVFGRLRRIRLY
jgi:hypothetical protein